MRKATKACRENKVDVQNLKAAIKPHAGMLKHAQEVINCKRRGSSRKPLKQKGCRKLKVLDAGNQASNIENLENLQEACMHI